MVATSWANVFGRLWPTLSIWGSGAAQTRPKTIERLLVLDLATPEHDVDVHAARSLHLVYLCQFELDADGQHERRFLGWGGGALSYQLHFFNDDPRQSPALAGSLRAALRRRVHRTTSLIGALRHARATDLSVTGSSVNDGVRSTSPRLRAL